MEQAEDHLPVHILHRAEVVPVFPEVALEVAGHDPQVILLGVAADHHLVQVQDPQVHQEADDNRSEIRLS